MIESRESKPLDALTREERDVVASAVPKRVAEFATGRWCARQAMARLGIPGFPLLPDSNRAPVWPPGVVGSITHTDGFCAAAVSRRDRYLGIGIDAELAGSVRAELWPLLFTLEEIRWLEKLSAQRRATMATVMFSAKESFYKAQYSLTNAWLDFQSAVVRVGESGWSLTLVDPVGELARLQSPIGGSFAIHDRLVMTAIAIGNHV